MSLQCNRRLTGLTQRANSREKHKHIETLCDSCHHSTYHAWPHFRLTTYCPVTGVTHEHTCALFHHDDCMDLLHAQRIHGLYALSHKHCLISAAPAYVRARLRETAKHRLILTPGRSKQSGSGLQVHGLELCSHFSLESAEDIQARIGAANRMFGSILWKRHKLSSRLCVFSALILPIL